MATKDFNTATLTPDVLYSGRIAATATNLYTVQAGQMARLYTLTLCSTNGSAVNIDVYVVPSDQSVADQYKIINSYSLAPGDSISLSQYVSGMMLGEGDSIQAIASTTNVTNAVLTGVVGA